MSRVNNLPSVQSPARVLVVEDDPDLSASLGMFITELGYQANLATNGREALEVLARHTPALILIDLVMPVMSGGELLRALRDDPMLARIPRVVMTGINDLMIGIKENVEVLYKPLDHIMLTKVLRRYCHATARAD
ncbi:MAG: response regulator [Deltaproteobacteria bacterium]|nr:response regulator [Deltaproteobacteria bacterium]